MLLHAALHSEGPTIVLESGYGQRAEVVLEASPPSAAVVRPGGQCTVLAWGEAVQAALRVPQVEVIDLRVLTPLDLDTITASVRRTGRVVVAGQGPFAESLLYRASQASFLYLESPPALSTVDDLDQAVRASIHF